MRNNWHSSSVIKNICTLYSFWFQTKMRFPRICFIESHEMMYMTQSKMYLCSLFASLWQLSSSTDKMKVFCLQYIHTHISCVRYYSYLVPTRKLYYITEFFVIHIHFGDKTVLNPDLLQFVIYTVDARIFIIISVNLISLALCLSSRTRKLSRSRNLWLNKQFPFWTVKFCTDHHIWKSKRET